MASFQKKTINLNLHHNVQYRKITKFLLIICLYYQKLITDKEIIEPLHFETNY